MQDYFKYIIQAIESGTVAIGTIILKDIIKYLKIPKEHRKIKNKEKKLQKINKKLQKIQGEN